MSKKRFSSSVATNSKNAVVLVWNTVWNMDLATVTSTVDMWCPILTPQDFGFRRTLWQGDSSGETNEHTLNIYPFLKKT